MVLIVTCGLKVDVLCVGGGFDNWLWSSLIISQDHVEIAIVKLGHKSPMWIFSISQVKLLTCGNFNQGPTEHALVVVQDI